MTTTNTYNPLLRAFRELTTPQAFRWYLTQAKATATLASTIAFRSYTQRLLSDRNSIAIAPAIAKPENAEFLCEEIAPTIAPAVQGDSVAVAGLENAISPQQEYALTEATEPEDSPVSYDWELIEPNYAEQTETEPELNDSESDRLAIDELEQEYAQAEAIAPEADFGDAESLCEAIAGDGEADAEDITKLRYWAELELPSILDETSSHLVDDADNSEAGAEAED